MNLLIFLNFLIRERAPNQARFNALISLTSLIISKNNLKLKNWTKIN